MTDLDQLDIMRRAITALGLGQCAPEELVAEARASSSRREQDRGTLADQRARIKDLESALRDLGVNPDGDLQGEVRAISNRAAGDSAAAQHDLDCALRERDAANAKIASNTAEAAARDMRIAELERDLADKDKSLKIVCEALSQIHAIIGGYGQGNPADAVAAVETLRGASQHAEARVRETEATMREIGLALDDAGAPAVYDLPDDTERPIPDPERIRILGDRVRGARRERDRSSDDHTARCVEMSNAHLALDDRSVPRHADGIALTLAARIRAIPC